jgi:hypothetical protein
MFRFMRKKLCSEAAWSGSRLSPLCADRRFFEITSLSLRSDQRPIGYAFNLRGQPAVRFVLSAQT